MSKSHDFPFGIMDVAELLHLRRRRPHSTGAYYDCPFCDDKRGKMSLCADKDVFRCNYCGEHGGMLSLYARMNHISNSEAYREICEALQNGEFATYCEPSTPAPREQVCPEQSTLADIRTIHQTFSMMLNMLTLTKEHREHLRNKRGLTDAQIDKLMYRSTPPFYLCKKIARQLIEKGCSLRGVPGFYIKDGEWTVKFYSKTAGILIPVRGIDGLIRGMQIRLDVPIKDENDSPDKSGTKYIWLSSVGKEMGTSSGSPVHFVGDPFARSVFLTEGFLKADIAHYLMNRSFVAIAGVNNTAQLELMFTLLKENGTQIIVEAADMDKFRNENVDRGVSNIYMIAKKCGLEFRRLTWNPNYKGIDDWQLALKRKQLEKEGCRMNFKKRFIYGLCEFDCIDDEIAAWHESTESQGTLYEHLGFTAEEYESFVQADEEIFANDLLRERHEQRYRIYQLDFSDGKPKSFAFEGIKALLDAGYRQPPAAEYALVCEDKIFCHVNDTDKVRLELIFNRYSDTLPEGYTGRSIAPSDVVELFDEEGRLYFYRDKDHFCPIKFSPMLAKKKMK